jgi:hypothetical protein
VCVGVILDDLDNNRRVDRVLGNVFHGEMLAPSSFRLLRDDNDLKKKKKKDSRGRDKIYK